MHSFLERTQSEDTDPDSPDTVVVTKDNVTGEVVAQVRSLVLDPLV